MHTGVSESMYKSACRFPEVYGVGDGAGVVDVLKVCRPVVIVDQWVLLTSVLPTSHCTHTEKAHQCKGSFSNNCLHHWDGVNVTDTVKSNRNVTD